MSIQRRKLPRALTVTLSSASQPCLVVGGKKYTLRNFSEQGIGLWLIPPAACGLVPGSKLSGEVLIENTSYPVQLEVMHLSESGVGLKILDKTNELDTLLQHLLEPTVYASRLELVSSTPIEDPLVGGDKIWFTLGTESELILWYHPGAKMIQGLQLSWLGKWIYREQFQLVQTGFVQENTKLGFGRKFEDADLLVHHKEANLKILQQAAQFLSSVPAHLPGYLFWQFLESGEQVYLPIDMILAKKVG